MFVNWADLGVLLSKLSLKRVINAVKIVNSYLLSRISGKPGISGFPISMAIEPTTACNLRCPECPSGLRSFTRPTGKMSGRAFERIIDEIAPHTTYLTFYFQGEPYLNPDFLEMVRYAAGRRMYTATSTNGHFLDDQQARDTVQSGLDRLIISIDGTDQETYEAYRKEGSLQKVLDGTRNIVAWKKKLGSKTPSVIWQFLVVKPNEEQIPEVLRLGEEYGVDKVLLKTAQVYEFEEGNELIPTIDKYSRYRLRRDGTYEIKNKLLDHCWKMWSSCVITWDGQVIPCCFDKDAGHRLGDLSSQRFEEVWHSTAYQGFRSAVIRSRAEVDMCKNCSMGTKVWA